MENFVIRDRGIFDTKRNRMVVGVSADSEKALKTFIKEEASNLKDYSDANSSLSFIGFVMYKGEITAASVGKQIADEWFQKGVRVS